MFRSQSFRFVKRGEGARRLHRAMVAYITECVKRSTNIAITPEVKRCYDELEVAIVSATADDMCELSTNDCSHLVDAINLTTRICRDLRGDDAVRFVSIIRRQVTRLILNKIASMPDCDEILEKPNRFTLTPAELIYRLMDPTGPDKDVVVLFDRLLARRTERLAGARNVVIVKADKRRSSLFPPRVAVGAGAPPAPVVVKRGGRGRVAAPVITKR